MLTRCIAIRLIPSESLNEKIEILNGFEPNDQKNDIYAKFSRQKKTENLCGTKAGAMFTKWMLFTM